MPALVAVASRWQNWASDFKRMRGENISANHRWRGRHLHFPDVFVPKLGVGSDTGPHQFYTLGVVDDGQFDSALANVILGALKGAILADDDARDVVKQSRAAAHVAGRQGGIKGRPAVVTRLEPACVFETIHLGVQNGATLLDTAIVSPTD